MTHQKLFEAMPFPVFAADKNGLIHYKNQAAGRYIGSMRKGSRVTRCLLGEEVPKSGTVAHITTGTPYPNALVVSDEEESLFLCFSRLQYPDFETVAKQILTLFGRTPTEIYEAFEKHSVPQEISKTSARRIYTELIGLKPQRAAIQKKPYSLGALAGELFTEAEKAFLAFGYRIQADITQDFLQNHPINTEFFDLLFLFGRMLYFAMKLSDDGKISVTLTSESETENHLLRFYTRTSQKRREEKSALALFAEIAPECAAEIPLMPKADAFSDPLTAEFDTLGGFSLAYRIPYLAPSLTLRSPLCSEEHSPVLAGLFSRIRGMLKENSSSC